MGGGGVLILDGFGATENRPTEIVLTSIRSNTGESLGGGLLIWAMSDLFLYNCAIHDNSIIPPQPLHTEVGAGLYFRGSGSKRVVNCLVVHNNNTGVPDIHGGGIEVETEGDGQVEVNGSTIAHNGPAKYGGGIDTKGVRVQIYNSILWGNQATTGRQIRLAATGTLLDPQYSDIERLSSNDVVTGPPAPTYVACLGTSPVHDPEFLDPPYDYAPRVRCHPVSMQAVTC